MPQSLLNEVMEVPKLYYTAIYVSMAFSEQTIITPSLHIKSRPIRLTVHSIVATNSWQKKNLQFTGTVSGSVDPSAPIDVTLCACVVGKGINEDFVRTEKIVPKST